RLRRRHLVLARPAGLRAGPALERLALPGARVLFGRGVVVLVPCRTALPRPAALVALASVAVPDPGRPVEHRPGRPADLLPPPAVPLLRGGAAPGGDLPPGRPGRGGRPHVGAGVRGVPPAAVRHRRRAPVCRWGKRKEPEGEGEPSGARAALPAGALAPGKFFPATCPPTPDPWLRPAPRPAGGPLPEMAPRPALLAAPPRT